MLTAEANGSSAIYRIEPKAGEDAVSANTYWKLYPYNQYSYPSIFDEEFTINDKPKKVIDAIRGWHPYIWLQLKINKDYGILLSAPTKW